MKEITKSFSNGKNRREVRNRIIKVFSREEPGNGKGDKASRYRYFVETLKDNNRIYLNRPAVYHYGYDFLVCVENTNYAKKGERSRNYPKHDDIKNDLLKKKKESPNKYKKLYTLIQRIYNCEDVTDDEMEKLKFKTGFPVDHILKVLK